MNEYLELESVQSYLEHNEYIFSIKFNTSENAYIKGSNIRRLFKDINQYSSRVMCFIKEDAVSEQGLNPDKKSGFVYAFSKENPAFHEYADSEDDDEVIGDTIPAEDLFSFSLYVLQNEDEKYKTPIEGKYSIELYSTFSDDKMLKNKKFFLKLEMFYRQCLGIDLDSCGKYRILRQELLVSVENKKEGLEKVIVDSSGNVTVKVDTNNSLDNILKGLQAQA